MLMHKYIQREQKERREKKRNELRCKKIVHEFKTHAHKDKSNVYLD